jgi:Domain of unknown function (DUF6794)
MAQSTTGRSPLASILALVASVGALSVVLDLPPLSPVYLPEVKKPTSVCATPRSLQEAHDILGRLLDPGLRATLMSASEGELAGYNRTLGRWLRNSWGLWNGGPMRDHLRALGLRHADDMSEFLIVTFRRHLRNEPLRALEEAARLRKADESDASRFRPQCRCFHIGGCTTSTLLDPAPGPERAVAITGCCCGQLPQIGEGKPVANPESHSYWVFPSLFALQGRACGPSSGTGS